MLDDGRTPLQEFLVGAISGSGRTRDSYDSELQKKLNTKGKPLWDIERGKVKRPSPRVLRAIEQVFRFPHDVLLTLVYPSEWTQIVEREDLKANTTGSRNLSLNTNEGIVEINCVDLSLPIGPGASVDEYVEGQPIGFDVKYLQTITRTSPEHLRLARGVGDSMMPTILPNDDMLIDLTQNQLLHSDRIYAASINGGAAIKRLRPIEGGRRVLVISDNKTIEPYAVDAIEVVIWGRVIRCAKNL